MKTFEEKYTAWIDGKLQGAELEAFEKQLEDREVAVADKASAGKLGALLRAHSQAPVLENPDFFNHGILHRIQSETEPVKAKPKAVWWRLSFGQLAWAGMASLVVAGGLFTFLIPKGAGKKDPYYAQIVDARASEQHISVTPIYEGDVTLLWVDGLDYLPDTYKLQ